MSTPRHIAIIMDGNGRWAKKRGLPKIVGHKQGVESVKRAVSSCIKFGVKYLTVYAFSTENWQRPRPEVRALFGLLENFLKSQMRIFHKNNVRLRVIGERDRIEPGVRKKIEQAEKDTAHYDKLILNIALSYGSRQEIVNAARALSQDAKDGTIDPSGIDEKLFAQYLYTKDSPDPDLLIRTSGEMRLSNFLLWQLSYAEIYVTQKFWPDFREGDLKAAIDEYQKRERRFGR
ncbi:MAG: isoprenyl transferase [Candidatus Omnitrophica bacterium]|nr:isoprenyl transferase [Candidatus Omnitrophota bacterium]